MTLLRFLHQLSHLNLACRTRIKSRRAVIKAAHRDAVHIKSLPPGELTAQQADILASRERQRERLLHHTDGIKRTCEANLQSDRLLSTELSFDTDVQGTRHKLARILDEAVPALEASWANVQHKALDLQRFRVVHGLIREAIYPPSRTVEIVLLFGLVLVEASVNAPMFAGLNSLADGFLIAVGVSLVNVGGAVMVGIVSGRRLFYSEAGARSLARLVVCLYVLAALALHGFIVYLRLQFLPSGQVSWLVLFLVGVFFGGLAFATGYSGLDDRYAGYGAVTREFENAVASHEALAGSYQSQIKATADDSEGLVWRKRTTTERVIGGALGLIAMALWCSQFCRRIFERIDRRCALLFHLYTEEFYKLSTTNITLCAYPAAGLLETDEARLHDSRKVLTETLRSKACEADAAVAAIRQEEARCRRQLAGIGGTSKTPLPYGGP